MAVSASPTCANWTTPHPLERVPSKRISASSTVPVVSNSSTRSSLAVDHGSYHEDISAAIADKHNIYRKTHVSNHNLLARLRVVGRGAICSACTPISSPVSVHPEASTCRCCCCCRLVRAGIVRV